MAGRVVDFFMNLQSPQAAEQWKASPMLAGVTAELFRTEAPLRPYTVEMLLEGMAACAVDVCIVSGIAQLGNGPIAANYGIHEVLASCEKHPERMRATLMFDSVPTPRAACRLLGEVVEHDLLAYVQVVPLVLGEPINSPRLYPIYERCEAHGLPVSINVGVPGPRVRAKLQDPMLLDDVLIDFPDLTVIGAHMGHPWEKLLIRFMQKYENLYLTNSAFLAKYMDPAILRFMASSQGRDRLIFGSDAPLISLERAVGAARQLDLPEDVLSGFLGENCIRALGLTDLELVPKESTGDR